MMTTTTSFRFTATLKRSFKGTFFAEKQRVRNVLSVDAVALTLPRAKDHFEPVYDRPIKTQVGHHPKRFILSWTGPPLQVSPGHNLPVLHGYSMPLP